MKYLKGKLNGKGKEYYNDNLIFEGVYLYDFCLKSKSYAPGRMEYWGKYIYNRKWNRKGYNENVNLIDELINGKVKEYSQNDNLNL